MTQAIDQNHNDDNGGADRDGDTRREADESKEVHANGDRDNNIGVAKENAGLSDTAAATSVVNGSTDGGYKIGYGKPPKQHQFRKGQSGNPTGRKRREIITDVSSVVSKILAEPIKLRNGRRVRQVSKLGAITETIRQEALEGNVKATRTFLKLAQSAGLLPRADLSPGVQILEPESTATGDKSKILRGLKLKQVARNNSVNAAAQRHANETQGRPH